MPMEANGNSLNITTSLLGLFFYFVFVFPFFLLRIFLKHESREITIDFGGTKFRAKTFQSGGSAYNSFDQEREASR